MRLVSIAQETCLLQKLANLPTDLPVFMTHSPVASVTYDYLADCYPELQFGLLDDDDALIAKVQAVPIQWAGLDALPDRGWDQVLLDAFRPGLIEDSAGPRRAVSLLEAHVLNELRGRGLSYELISRVRESLARLGITDLVGPVRPNQKCREPRTPIAEYASRKRADGLPVDPWLRVHVRLGGVIVKTCPVSMTIPGTLSQWRDWTGLPFDASGDVEVPEALASVHVDVDQDHAVYVEPNVWVHHDLT